MMQINSFSNFHFRFSMIFQPRRYESEIFICIVICFVLPIFFPPPSFSLLGCSCFKRNGRNSFTGVIRVASSHCNWRAVKATRTAIIPSRRKFNSGSFLAATIARNYVKFNERDGSVHLVTSCEEFMRESLFGGGGLFLSPLDAGWKGKARVCNKL